MGAVPARLTPLMRALVKLLCERGTSRERVAWIVYQLLLAPDDAKNDADGHAISWIAGTIPADVLDDIAQIAESVGDSRSEWNNWLLILGVVRRAFGPISASVLQELYSAFISGQIHDPDGAIRFLRRRLDGDKKPSAP